jgi:putative transposase
MAGKYLSLMIHFVWSTTGRKPFLSPDWQHRMYSYIGRVLKNKKAALICAGGTRNHVHLYASLPSTITIAEMVNFMKSNLSRWVHENCPHLKAFAWQDGYGAFSVSKSAEQKLIEYIENQEVHHRKRDFKEEFLNLLEGHGIEYDEKYLWD